MTTSDTRPRLLLVDQGEQHAKEYLVRRLNKLGYRLTLLQWNSVVWSPELFDDIHVAGLTNWKYVAETVYAEHRRDPFSGVLCYNEGAVLAANDVARLLSLPPISRFDAESFRHKDRMRVAWEALGVPVPKYRVLYGPVDARILRTWDYPIVLKPTAAMGSKGVLRVDSYEELTRVLPSVLATDLEFDLGGQLWTMSEAFNLPPFAIAEQYVPGPEFSAEGVVVDGTYHLIGVVEKVLTQEPWFDEVGHIFPSEIPTPGQAAELRSLLQRAHDALGMANAITHTEFRMPDGDVVLMELNARIAGGQIPELVEKVTHLDIADLAARTACGTASVADIPVHVGESTRPVAVAFLPGDQTAYGKQFVAGVLPSLPAGCVEISTEWYLAPGDVIPRPMASGTTRLGHIVFQAPTREMAWDGIAALRAGVGVDFTDSGLE